VGQSSGTRRRDSAEGKRCMEQIRLAKGMETLLITLYAKAADAHDP
jgi:hypothetical protein